MSQGDTRGNWVERRSAAGAVERSKILKKERANLRRRLPRIKKRFELELKKNRRLRDIGRAIFTMIHSGTLCIQRKVTKLPCFGGLVFRAQFQHFLSAFRRSFFCCAVSSCVYDHNHPYPVSERLSLQRTRLFRTCGELWSTRGELWLYFEMQRRLDLWSFSWSSRRSREAQK